MAVPKRKLSKKRSNSRFANWDKKLKTLNLAYCPKCHEAMQSHRVCKNCGEYAAKQRIDVTKKKSAKE